MKKDFRDKNSEIDRIESNKFLKTELSQHEIEFISILHKVFSRCKYKREHSDFFEEVSVFSNDKFWNSNSNDPSSNKVGLKAVLKKYGKKNYLDDFNPFITKMHGEIKKDLHRGPKHEYFDFTKDLSDIPKLRKAHFDLGKICMGVCLYLEIEYTQVIQKLSQG